MTPAPLLIASGPGWSMWRGLTSWDEATVIVPGKGECASWPLADLDAGEENAVYSLCRNLAGQLGFPPASLMEMGREGRMWAPEELAAA